MNELEMKKLKKVQLLRKNSTGQKDSGENQKKKKKMIMNTEDFKFMKNSLFLELN